MTSVIPATETVAKSKQEQRKLFLLDREEGFLAVTESGQMMALHIIQDRSLMTLQQHNGHCVLLQPELMLYK